jgi:hypothetical protein
VYTALDTNSTIIPQLTYEMTQCALQVSLAIGAVLTGFRKWISSTDVNIGLSSPKSVIAVIHANSYALQKHVVQSTVALESSDLSHQIAPKNLPVHIPVLRVHENCM